MVFNIDSIICDIMDDYILYHNNKRKVLQNIRNGKIQLVSYVSCIVNEDAMLISSKDLDMLEKDAMDASP